MRVGLGLNFKFIKHTIKKNVTSLKKKLTLLAGGLLTCFGLSAQDTPFFCDFNAYLFQFNDVYSIDLASGSSYQVATDITGGNINGTGYNPVDGYIWGSLSTPASSIVRIGKNYTTTTYMIAGLPSSNRYIGDVSTDGVYFLKGGGTSYYKVDLDPSSSNYLTLLSTESLSQGILIHDWAFNAVDGNLYTVEKNSNILYRVNPADGIVESLGEVPILSGLNYTYGAVYFDVTGNFYVSANQSGTIYIIRDVQNLGGTSSISSNLFAFGPSSSSNDGARCPTAPVPQEDCINGVDDDGDGLVDCDDPSCSGFASCPVIEPPTSSSNSGGLESNNRLSEQISKRNFNRLKSSYKFNRNTAPKVSKSAKYAKKNEKSNLQLQDFIPLNTINEDFVVESSPTDLLNITNATDVYSVDYIENDNTVASILALKTEDGVYEHTKYICDRLLGAELISVSTVEINGQSFLRSIIRNSDESIEFVLSLSESHWNIDKYEDNVTFYNFQIWSNSLDDLLLLGEEVIHLIGVQKPITEYNNSEAPTVFVRKGKYINGKLDLQIVNTNASGNVNFDAGLRDTETSVVRNISSSIDLEEKYITNLELETGNLFDIGFRIGDGIQTPDDLFMSDGPWGLDDLASSTHVDTFTILPNEESFETNEFPIERNITLKASTSDYISAYRALTPRFKAVDMSDYSSFKLKAKGTGALEIRFVKESINNWEEQYKTTIMLTEDLKDFDIPFSDFHSSNGSELVLDDVVTVVFKMIAENGQQTSKEMTLKELRFSMYNGLSFEDESLNKVPVFVPNPMISTGNIHFITPVSENVSVLVYNQSGRVVKRIEFKAIAGRNQIAFNREGLDAGFYFCQIVSEHNYYETIKLIIK